MLCYVFALFFFCLMYPMVPVSLGCPFLIAPPVFSSLYSFMFSVNLFTYVQTRFSYQMKLASLSSNTTGVATGTGTVFPYRNI